MLERIRDKSQGVGARLILGLVILTFALAGIGGYLSSTPPPAAASVNGVEISQRNFEQRYQAELNRMQQQFGQFFDTLSADEQYMENFRSNVLNQLVRDELQNQAAEEIGLYTSDESIVKMVRTMPEFQIDGKFDNDRYLLLIRQAGYTADSFFTYLRQEQTRRQLGQAIFATEFGLSSETKDFIKLEKQTRDVEYVLVNKADYVEQVSIEEQELTEFYQANIDQYQTAEKLSLEYVQVKLTDLMSDVAVTDEEVQDYYQQNIDEFKTSAARRQVSYIFFELGDDEAQSQAKAEAVLTRLNAGEEFAELAKAESMDSFTAENGGDLGWITAGENGDEFDQAVFALANIGDTSGVVRTDDGFNIFKLTADEPEVTQALADVTEQIKQSIKRFAATEVFEDKYQSLRDVSFESPESLDEAAASVDVSVEKTALFSRNAAPQVVNYPEVLQAGFSEQVLTEKYNSDVIEINDEHIIVVRLLQHLPVRTLEQQEVAERIKAALTEEKSQQLAKQQADRLLAELAQSNQLAEVSGIDAESLINKAGLSREASDVDSQLRSAIFKLPHPESDKLSSAVLELSTGDYAVVALSAVNTGELPENIDSTQNQLSSQISQRSFSSFILGLEQDADVVK